MNIEKITIKNFAGLKYINMEFKKINILIGPQASGKSIIAKILFYFKGIVQEIISHGLKLKYKKDFDNTLKEKFEIYFPPYTWTEGEFHIEYRIANEFIIVSGNASSNPQKSELSIKYSDFYKKSLTQIRKNLKKVQKKTTEYEDESEFLTTDIEIQFDLIRKIQYSFLETVSNQFWQDISFSQLFIPAGRSFFANLQKNIFSFISENAEIDPFLVDFGKYYDLVKSSGLMQRRLKRERKNSDFQRIEHIKRRILCGDYKRIRGEDYLKMNDGREIKLSHSSSGQQETLPLTMILESLTFLNIGMSSTGKTTYIEEPEAHLFPTAQKDIVDFIVAIYNLKKDRLQFFITTHSPYILSSFNNLLQAGVLLKNAPEANMPEIKKHVIDSLNYDEVSVYSLSNGYCESILSDDTQLINSEIIDAVSQDLAVHFDKLLELE
jgi:predicted ATPase